MNIKRCRTCGHEKSAHYASDERDGVIIRKVCAVLQCPCQHFVAPEPMVITARVCGGRAAHRCIDGGVHHMSQMIRTADGGTLACTKCGATAMNIDMLELP